MLRSNTCQRCKLRNKFRYVKQPSLKNQGTAINRRFSNGFKCSIDSLPLYHQSAIGRSVIKHGQIIPALYTNARQAYADQHRFLYNRQHQGRFVRSSCHRFVYKRSSNNRLAKTASIVQGEEFQSHAPPLSRLYCSFYISNLLQGRQ